MEDDRFLELFGNPQELDFADIGVIYNETDMKLDSAGIEANTAAAGLDTFSFTGFLSPQQQPGEGEEFTEPSSESLPVFTPFLEPSIPPSQQPAAEEDDPLPSWLDLFGPIEPFARSPPPPSPLLLPRPAKRPREMTPPPPPSRPPPLSPRSARRAQAAAETAAMSAHLPEFQYFRQQHRWCPLPPLPRLPPAPPRPPQPPPPLLPLRQDILEARRAAAAAELAANASGEERWGRRNRTSREMVVEDLGWETRMLTFRECFPEKWLRGLETVRSKRWRGLEDGEVDGLVEGLMLKEEDREAVVGQPE